MILVTGTSGQIGGAVASLLGTRAIAADRSVLDLSDTPSIAPTLDKLAPQAIVHAAAYTAVDKAESEPALAHAINALAPAEIARYCAKSDIPLIYLSTDYVYDGSGNSPRNEDTPTRPLNVYGQSKFAGEEAVRASGARALILRTSWVVDGVHKNFLTTMLRVMRTQTTVRVVSDQVGAPSYAPHLAEAIVALLNQEVVVTGTYHFCHQGEVSWHGFAEAIAAGARARGASLDVETITPIPTQDYPTPAQRPLNSRLCTQKLQRDTGILLPPWQEGLEAALTVALTPTLS